MVTSEAIRRAKLQSKFHRQQTNSQLFTGRMPFLSTTVYLFIRNYKRMFIDKRVCKFWIYWSCGKTVFDMITG